MATIEVMHDWKHTFTYSYIYTHQKKRKRKLLFPHVSSVGTKGDNNDNKNAEATTFHPFSSSY